jgi:guanine deaminase
MDWERGRAARLGLGSDVGAGPDLSIFRVARMAWTVHSIRESRTRPRPTAAELLFAATRGGAQSLGFHDIGALRPRFSADFIVLDAGQVIPPGAPATESTSDLLSRILHRAGRSSIREVYVAGVLRHEA